VASDSVVSAVEGYYAEKVRRHGATPSGVDWNGAEGQNLRFEQLMAILPAAGDAFSLIDYGCGYGALLDWMDGRGAEFRYTGYDVSSAMIEQARSAHSARGSFTSDAADLVPADYTVASGIFNVKLDASEARWERHVNETIDEMVRLSARGIAFNALTSHADADRKRTDLYYADPAELLDRCLRLYSRDVELRHNYELYEFTLLVWLDGRPPAATTRRN
jgi:Methyltransferase domain